VEKQATSSQDVSNQQADKQKAGAPDADKQTAAAATPLAAAGGNGEIELPTLAEAPKPRPENTPKSSPAKVSRSGSRSARSVRRLYSQGAHASSSFSLFATSLHQETVSS
jgi:hypothetical protein